MKVLLAVTGSSAAKLTYKLASKLEKNGHQVKIIVTDTGAEFIKDYESTLEDNFRDWSSTSDEFFTYFDEPGKHIKHIELARWADVMLIAPCTINTLVKITNGITDNIVLSTYRAFKEKTYLALSANTEMIYNSIPFIELAEKIKTLKLIYPTVKTLDCGEHGFGAMAHIDDIVNITEGHKWKFPILYLDKGIIYNRAALNPFFRREHPALFGTQRKNYTHMGVDIYSYNKNDDVIAVEDGEIITIESFTGEQCDSPWWNNTFCIVIKGKSGKVVYGEINPNPFLDIGDTVKAGDWLGKILQVVKKEPENKPQWWSPRMLHLELLTYEAPKNFGEWDLDKPRPKWLKDPTCYLF